MYMPYFYYIHRGVHDDVILFAVIALILCYFSDKTQINHNGTNNTYLLCVYEIYFFPQVFSKLKKSLLIKGQKTFNFFLCYFI